MHIRSDILLFVQRCVGDTVIDLSYAVVPKGEAVIVVRGWIGNVHIYGAFLTGDPAGELAQKAADLHRQWLSYFWDHYSKEAHAGLAQMYVDDERFKAYYDQKQSGMAEFLRDAIFIYTGKK
ncbi:MerR family transcriptional regulator [Anoxybacillus flavithermus AK1]|uniref:MerR family transcriptional regulator n=1 Tax=Anoxybacillus flavithermus AK1 TaxID=1297581 RepID=M8DWN2_9BACL|nr:MerR family transcriptional regulator [Anoxybacillus flavithermus AK1]